jgi:ATP-binding cassette subfamily F protein uup
LALISLRDITLAFGGPSIFDGINLQIEQGDRLCLMSGDRGDVVD